MRVRVVYQSTTGNTRKFAGAIARAVGCVAEPVGTGFEGNKEMEVGIMRDLLARRRIPVMSKHYFCLGKFLFFNFRHPNAQDMNGAEEFARSALAD